MTIDVFVRLNTNDNDMTLTDLWEPSIAANPAGTEIFIGYYSRQNNLNHW